MTSLHHCCSFPVLASPYTDRSFVAVGDDRRNVVQLRQHGRVSNHVLRKGSNVVRGGWSGAVPLWSESS